MTSWIGFLKEQHEVLTNTPQTLWITTYNWVETVVRDGILPALKQAGYVSKVEPSGLASCILNVLYRHQYDYQKARFTHYRCCHGREVSHPPEGANARLEDQIEYFHELLPTSVWEEMHARFPVRFFADGGMFAERIWGDLPHVVAWHVRFNESPANHALEDRLRHLDEEEEEGEEAGPANHSHYD